ncbi:MAG: TRAP transporter small permease [Bowdeniella nasicola]|nr:TRAP transporter small permease [Bowdeniella nasicola]
MLATLATLVMMIAIAIDVVFRLVNSRSVPGVLELSETALVAAVYLGLAYTGVTNSHIAVDLLTERLPERICRWVLTAAWAGSTFILGWMLYATTMRAYASFIAGEERMGLVAWPIWPGRWIIVIGLAAMFLVSAVNFVRTALGREVLGVDAPDHLTYTPAHPYELVVSGDTDPEEDTP